MNQLKKQNLEACFENTQNLSKKLIISRDTSKRLGYLDSTDLMLEIKSLLIKKMRL
jgi:hypothetical protein